LRRRRRIREGDEYTVDEEDRGRAEREEVEPDPDPPPEEVRGEPWGWRKLGPRPRGWPGPDHSRDDPGPFDGEWELPL
jgi:hypothetical protein